MQRVNVFKLLGVDCLLKWDNHVDAICNKASSRLFFLKLLRRSSVSSDDLLHFYESYIRPTLEYACCAWHTSLTHEQSLRIERIQRRALIIVYGHINQNDYASYCKEHNISTLYDRRELLCKQFFNSIVKVDSCLHYLLPSARCSSNQVLKLRNFLDYVPPIPRSERYKQSFLPYSMMHYQ